MMGPGMRGGFDPEQTTAWLDNARREIGVTAAQEQAWTAYADAVQADRAAMAAMHAQMPAMMGGAGADAPTRLQAHLSFMQARLDSLRQVTSASEALYEVLTPEQRTQANRTLWSGCW
jgi:Spy/CpxP family protein refolding chaperone